MLYYYKVKKGSAMSRAAAFHPPAHDHERCIAAALAAAQDLCARRELRLTPLRRRVLELVWTSHRPVGAYALLEELRQEGKAAPPTVYRALDFLLEHGFIHRLASLNAYVGCSRPGSSHAGQFLICERCGDLAELNDPAVEEAIARSSRTAGFRPRSQTVEILGLCPRCE